MNLQNNWDLFNFVFMVKLNFWRPFVFALILITTACSSSPENDLNAFLEKSISISCSEVQSDIITAKRTYAHIATKIVYLGDERFKIDGTEYKIAEATPDNTLDRKWILRLDKKINISSSMEDLFINVYPNKKLDLWHRGPLGLFKISVFCLNCDFDECQ